MRQSEEREYVEMLSVDRIIMKLILMLQDRRMWAYLCGSEQCAVAETGEYGTEPVRDFVDQLRKCWLHKSFFLCVVQ